MGTVFVLVVLLCTTPNIDVAHAGRAIPNLSSNVRLSFSYIMGGGLCNQQLGQITGLLLGRHLQADTIYVPPPYFRDSFSKVFENTTWTLLEHSALWDMAKMKELLHKQNQTLVENKLISHNIVTERGAAVPEHATELQIVYLPEILKGRHDITTWMSDANEAIHAHVANHLAALQAMEREKGVVELHLTLRKPVLLGLEFRKAPDAVQVARFVDFAPKLHQLANAAVRKIRRHCNTRVFNGAHLRVEVDAKVYHEWFEGDIVGVWARYSEAAELVHFDRKTPIFVASGVYQTDDQEMMRQIQAWSDKHGLLVLHRGTLLGDEAAELHTEQLAAIDLLVLAQARSVVGFGYSSFTWVLAELRAFNGHSRNSMAQVTNKEIILDHRPSGATFDI